MHFKTLIYIQSCLTFHISYSKKKFSLILITSVITIFLLSNNLQFHKIWTIPPVYGKLQDTDDSIDVRGDWSRQVDTYAKSYPVAQRHKFKRDILKKSIPSITKVKRKRLLRLFISWHFILLFVAIFTDHAGQRIKRTCFTDFSRNSIVELIFRSFQ